MRFFILSLVINLVILLIPLKSKPLQEKPKQKIVVSLHVKEKQVKSAPKKVSMPKKEEIKKEVKKVEIKPKIKPKKVIKKRKKSPKKEKKAKQKVVTPIKSEKRILTPKEIKAPISKTHNNSIKGKKRKTYCKEGVDFKVIKKPNLKYPKRAVRMRIRKVVNVDVYFRVDMSGNIEILKTKGGSSIFVNEAIKRTQKMEIKLLSKEALKCKIIQPFRFEP